MTTEVEQQKNLIVLAKTDVPMVASGPAGLSAALAASRQGVNVLWSNALAALVMIA